MNNKIDLVRQNELAAKFHELHYSDEMLVLANAWDCASAKIFEVAGFKAVATTSSGISWSCGFKDGEHIPPDLMIEIISRIAGCVTIPVTADIEAGYYGDDLKKFSDFISDVIKAGAVGINLEDGDSKTRSLIDINFQIKKIKSVKEIANQNGVNLFLNARTDAIELAKGDLKTKIKICIERAKAFEEAGADGIFIPFVKEIKTVEELKKAIKLPLNILINDTVKIDELRKLKINRVSVGGKPMLASLSTLKVIADELLSGDNWNSLFVKDPNYLEVNKWFA